MSKSIYTQEQFDKILEERNELANENYKLKQQLAEKDKEIKELLNYDRCSHCSYGQANKEYREKCSELIEELAEVKNSCDYYMNRANDLLLKDQDNISFALEQLEKVKELYKKHLDYERIYDEFRVQRLEEDIEDLIADISKMVKTP